MKENVEISFWNTIHSSLCYNLVSTRIKTKKKARDKENCFSIIPGAAEDTFMRVSKAFNDQGKYHSNVPITFTYYGVHLVLFALERMWLFNLEPIK